MATGPDEILSRGNFWTYGSILSSLVHRTLDPSCSVSKCNNRPMLKIKESPNVGAQDNACKPPPLLGELVPGYVSDLLYGGSSPHIYLAKKKDNAWMIILLFVMKSIVLVS